MGQSIRFRFLVVFFVFLPAFLYAQVYRGTISGIVTDPSGGVIPHATVVATEINTGTRTQTVSNGSGQYTIPFLLPGNYQVSVEASGFRRLVRAGIHLASGDHVVVDLRLQVGRVSQSVNVTASVPLVDTANASVGQVITTKQVADLPLDGRTPMMLAQLAIGVSATSNPSLVHPFDSNGAAAWSMGGTPSQTSELLLNGVPDELWSGALAYSPPMDAVQEVTVNAFDTNAAYGHTFGGVANQVLKTGSNQFHGSAYEFTQASALDANNFFSNRSGVKEQVTHYNQYGLSAGGPVIIPKLYNGRNKLFWFFAWENLNDSQPNTDFATVPTAAERQGDFSALLNLGKQYQIYNPYSGALAGTAINRVGFLNNIIPTSMLNPIAQAYLQFYPMPNTAGEPDGSNNYVNSTPSTDSFNNELGELNFNMSPRSRLSFNIRQNDRLQNKNDYLGNIATGTNLTYQNWGATVDEVYTFNPTTVADVRANWTYFYEVHGDPGLGFNPTKLGFPSYIASSAQQLTLPAIQFSGSCGSQSSFQCLGGTGDSTVPSDSYQLFGDVMKVAGKHTLTFGADVREYRVDEFNYGSPSGSYTFGTNWTNGPTSGSAAAPFGQDFASFLLGLPTGGAYTVNSYGTFISHYYAFFLQDDWRLRPNLTLNLGLRFEHDTPYGESFGRTVNGFAFNATNPLQADTQAAFASDFPNGLAAGSGLPTLTQLNVPGGLTFASPYNGAAYNQTSHIFSPRVGFAWSPTALRNTVIRGGFGIFVQPITMATLSPNGNYSSSPIINQEGFSASTPFVATTTNYLSPANTLSNPFPTGIEQPVGSSEGLSTFLGQTVKFMDPTMQDPYSMRWNIGFQHSFRRNLMLEMDYMGNHAVHLPIQNMQLNYLPAAYLSTSPARDQALIDELNATVANPFEGLLPGTSLNGSKISVAQLLSTYPEYPFSYNSTSSGVIMQNSNAGSSYYNALDLRVQKRLSNGLSLIANYSYSKLIEEDTYLNAISTAPEKRISPFDYTNHFVLAATYTLPIGRGHWLSSGSHWVNSLLGGWTVNGIYTYQTGAPILWSNSDYIYYGGPLNYNPSQTGETLVNGKLKPLPSFNTAAFNTNSKDQLEYHIRTWPSTLSSIRYGSINNLDASLLKDFNFTERTYLQLRFEAFNALNRPQFGSVHGSAGPNMEPTKSSFGVLNGMANLPRQVQLGARLVW